MMKVPDITIRNVNVIHLLVTAKTANGICRHKFGDANVMCVGLARCCYFI